MSSATRLGFGMGYVSIPESDALNLLSAPNGGWIWFTDPRAVEHDGVTHFTYVEDPSGNTEIASYDAGSITGPTILTASFQADDHACPAILVRDSDKRLMVFYSQHLGANMYVRVSTNPNDASSFAARVTLTSQLGSSDYTYPHPVQLTAVANDPIHLFWRDYNGEHRLAHSVSSDDGSTWSAREFIIDADQGYWKIGSNGTDRIDFAVTDWNPHEFNDVSLFHFYYQGGSYFDSEGNAITPPVALASEATLVYDGTTVESWVSDVATNGGNPVIAYVKYPTEDEHIYTIARWNGTSWDHTELGDGGGSMAGGGGSPHYHGGLSLDHANPNVAWGSVLTSGQFEIFKYTTDDDWATFASEQITFASSSPQTRPVVPLNRSTGLEAVWMSGTYTALDNYSIGTRGY